MVNGKPFKSASFLLNHILGFEDVFCFRICFLLYYWYYAIWYRLQKLQNRAATVITGEKSNELRRHSLTGCRSRSSETLPKLDEGFSMNDA